MRGIERAGNLSQASLVLRAGDVTNPNASGKNFGFKDGIIGATLKPGALGKSTTFPGEPASTAGGTNLNLTEGLAPTRRCGH